VAKQNCNRSTDVFCFVLFCFVLFLFCDILSGYTPLIEAAIYGYLNIVKILVEAGADLNAKNKKGEFWQSGVILFELFDISNCYLFLFFL